jgi:Cytochrome c oxidase assembly protein CtaG/Cox11
MNFKNLLCSAVAGITLALPPYFILGAANSSVQAGLVRTVNNYLKSAYAHDYKKAYRLISNRDRMIKPEEVYVQEKGPFSGFTLTVAEKLAEMMEIRESGGFASNGTTHVKFNIKLPDASSLSTLLLDWDQDKLNALPPQRQKEILANIDNLRRAGKLKFIEGGEELTLVKENGVWRIWFDWAAGLRVHYDATVPGNEIIEATPLNRETSVGTNELFTIAYRVRNLSDQMIATRIIHRVEPQELRQYLDLVECALLLPVKLKPGEEREFSSTYMARGDLPDGSKQVKVTYEFQVEK